jgi:hypothetical protein
MTYVKGTISPTNESTQADEEIISEQSKHGRQTLDKHSKANQTMLKRSKEATSEKNRKDDTLCRITG